MSAVTDQQHAELGALHRKQTQVRAEMQSLTHRTDPGGVQRATHLREHLDKLQRKQDKLTQAIERQERTMRANGVREERLSMNRMLAEQGIRTQPVDGGAHETTIALEGGADEGESVVLARATGVNINTRGTDPFNCDPFRIDPAELRSRALAAVETHVVRAGSSSSVRLHGLWRCASLGTPPFLVGRVSAPIKLEPACESPKAVRRSRAIASRHRGERAGIRRRRSTR